MSPSSRSSRVVIVGAGPAGALLAVLLSSRGIDTLLVERQSDFSREFRGEVLMPSGLRALADADFALDSVAHSVPAVAQAFMNGREFLSVETAGLGDRRPTAVSQPELLEGLVARAQATGRFELRRGTTVRSVVQPSDGGIELEVRTAGVDGTERIRGDFLIGADGRGSVCRRHLAPRVIPRSVPLDVVWFKMPYPEAWAEPRARFEMGRGHLMIVVHSADGLLQMAWVILKGSYGDLKGRSHQQWVDEMSRHTDPELTQHLRDHRQAISRPFLLNAIADRVEGWASPGCLLIGDAAHTMSPVGGQGLNLALRDAIVAANALVPALRSGGDLDAAAARVEAIRAPEIDRIQYLASLPPRLVMGRSPTHELARRLLARIVPSRLGRTRAASVASLFLDGVCDVELQI